MVGEPTNKLVGYLAAISRKLEQPLAVLIQSQLGGRQILADGCGAAFVPGGGADRVLGDDRAEPVLHGREDLKHKILAIAEEEGASRGELCAEAAADRGRADHRLDRQGCRHGQAGRRRNTASRGR